MNLIDKAAVVAEIKRRRDAALMRQRNLEAIGQETCLNEMIANELNRVLQYTENLEVKEADEQKERMSKCPYRQVGCKMYEDKILECNGACSWVVDYQKSKELKAQKGEEIWKL